MVLPICLQFGRLASLLRVTRDQKSTRPSEDREIIGVVGARCKKVYDVPNSHFVVEELKGLGQLRREVLVEYEAAQARRSRRPSFAQALFVFNGGLNLFDTDTEPAGDWLEVPTFGEVEIEDCCGLEVSGLDGRGPECAARGDLHWHVPAPWPPGVSEPGILIEVELF